jgi:dihydropteroate synthase
MKHMQLCVKVYEKEVLQFLLDRATVCQSAGVAQQNIVLDPGFGFGKTFVQNIDLFHALPELAAAGYPLLVGISRKAMIGQLTGKGLPERMPGSVSAAMLAVLAGASIVRVHDVAETHDALQVMTALSSLKA